MTKEHLNFIGLIKRANALITGSELVINGIRTGKVKLVLIDSSVSENTFKKITDKCRFYHVSYIKVSQEVNLGAAIGKESRKIIGITDAHFAKALQEKIDKE